jgi:hypothetical protein
MFGLAVYNLNHPIYERRYFHQTLGRYAPQWRDAGHGSRIARLWISGLLVVAGTMLVRFALVA